MSDHRRLEVWKRSREFARRVHFVVMALPRVEQHRRGDQLIRSANSVPDNIAEGANTGSDPKYLNHVHTSIGSMNEAIDQVGGLADIAMLRNCDADRLSEGPEIACMLQGLVKHLEAKIANSPKKKARRKAPRRPNH